MKYSDYFPVFFTKEGAELYNEILEEEVKKFKPPLSETKSNFKYRQKQGAKPIKKKKMIIKDEALCGYEIHTDSHGYSVFHPSVDENGEVRVDKNGKVMGSTKGYYATLTGCAQKIAKLATEEGLETTTLKEYIDKLNSIANQIEDAVK